jgi:hypothetical protein
MSPNLLDWLVLHSIFGLQFYIDFWRQMNEELNLNYSFHIFSNNLAVINALKNDQIDIGLGLSITWKRATEVDFTQPIVDGSLRIMTKYHSAMNIWEMFMPFNWTLWVAILVLALINGHIIWWVERDSNTAYFPKFYLSGVREGLWFSFMNLMMMDDAVVRSLPVRKTLLSSPTNGLSLKTLWADQRLGLTELTILIYFLACDLQRPPC